MSIDSREDDKNNNLPSPGPRVFFFSNILIAALRTSWLILVGVFPVQLFNITINSNGCNLKTVINTF